MIQRKYNNFSQSYVVKTNEQKEYRVKGEDKRKYYLMSGSDGVFVNYLLSTTYVRVCGCTFLENKPLRKYEILVNFREVNNV